MKRLDATGTSDYLAVVLATADGHIWDQLPNSVLQNYCEMAVRVLTMTDMLLENHAKAQIWQEGKTSHNGVNPYLTKRGVARTLRLTREQAVNLDKFIDRIAQARYENLDSHFSMPGGLSWEEYKTDDPEMAEAMYIDPVLQEVLEALPELHLALKKAGR